MTCNKSEFDVIDKNTVEIYLSDGDIEYIDWGSIVGGGGVSTTIAVASALGVSGTAIATTVAAPIGFLIAVEVATIKLANNGCGTYLFFFNVGGQWNQIILPQEDSDQFTGA